MYQISYYDYVTKYKANATILFSVGLISGVLLYKYVLKKA